MTDQEFDTFLAVATGELNGKQRYLESEFGIGRCERFFIDYEKDELQFFEDGICYVTFSFTAVGTHVPGKRSWRWSWANPSLPESVSQKSGNLKKLFEMTGFEVFRQPDVSADEAMAWGFVALSCKALDTIGAYSMPQRDLRAYVLLDSIKDRA
jgi:hypothetical protein